MKTKRKFAPEMVEVVWNDASIRAEETFNPDRGDIRTPGFINRDVGYLVGTQDGFVVLAVEKDGGEECGRAYRTLVDIPIGDVLAIWSLRRDKKLYGTDKGVHYSGFGCAGNGEDGDGKRHAARKRKV